MERQLTNWSELHSRGLTLGGLMTPDAVDAAILDAYDRIHAEESDEITADDIVCHPGVNARFMELVGGRLIQDDIMRYLINKRLLYIRKQGRLERTRAAPP